VVDGNTLDNDCLIRALWIEIDQHGNFCSLRLECRDQRAEERDRYDKASHHDNVSFLFREGLTPLPLGFELFFYFAHQLEAHHFFRRHVFLDFERRFDVELH